MPTAPTYWKVLTRRKVLNNEPEADVKLNRILGLFDLTALGVGSTLGAGVYVLAGQIAKDQAGPSVMISFVIAALASALAGVCYAEFGARVPKAGSAYIYSYVCIGEFAAFIIGWNLILEYVIGTAGVCRSISLYLDTLLNDTLKTYFAEVAPIQWNFLGGYFDFLAFTLAVGFGAVTAFGVETSTMLNNFCTIINTSVLLFVVIAGSIKADISNWQIDPSTNSTESNYNTGKGGYFPFGFEGTLKGAATCFFGFVGFDCIATTGEEVRNPQKNIPRSIFYSLLIIFLSYFGVSTVLTLMVPYYRQDPNAPLPYAFKEVGWEFAMWVVTIGGLIGLLASLLGALFPIPRILYSMAEDGLLFRFLGKVSPRFKTPVNGTIFTAFFTGIIAGAFDLAQLVNLLSIGTLLAYTVVAISITILRFMNSNSKPNSYSTDFNITENSMLTSNDTRITFKIVVLQVFNYQRISTPNYLSSKIVGALILFFCIISLSCALLIKNAAEAIINHELWALAILSTFIALIVILLIAISMQPRELHTSIFCVPLVPLVPAISIFTNIYLMLQLDVMTWIRFGIWMVIGLPIIVICFCTHSKSRKIIKNRKQLFMHALEKCNILCNDRLETEENKNRNNSIIILVTQPPEDKYKQTNNENEYRKSVTGRISFGTLLVENIRKNSMNHNSSSNENQSALVRGNSKEEHWKGITTEEQNSVIAMLDNVLQNEDDNDITTSADNQQINFNLESTLDFVKTTAVAIIHNNHRPLSGESFQKGNLVNKKPQTENYYKEVWQLAFDLVDGILQSETLVNNVTLRRKYKDVTQKSINNCESLDRDSVDDADLRSDNFKKKLSLLIIQPPRLTRLKRNDNQFIPKSEFSQELKLSRSEANVPKMIFKTIKAAQNKQNLKIEGFNIPIPPKFDPVLYKTLGSTVIRTRPKIDKLIADKNATTTVSELCEEMPFKIKLEAILKRGPSHRMQKRSDFITPQTSLVDNTWKPVKHDMPLPPDNLSHKTNLNRPIVSLKSESNDIEAINRIRKKLRHVDNTWKPLKHNMPLPPDDLNHKTNLTRPIVSSKSGSNDIESINSIRK